MRFTPRKYTRIVPILRIIRPCVAKDCTGKIERTLGAGVEVSGRVGHEARPYQGYCGGRTPSELPPALTVRSHWRHSSVTTGAET
jgi:hypothetical protein